MSIKILVISNYKDYHTTRPEAEIFIGLAKLGFKVFVMMDSSFRYAKEFTKSGVTVINYPVNKKFDKVSTKKIRQVLIDEKIDILQLYNSNASSNGISAAKGLPVKVVLYRGYTGNINWFDPSMYTKYFHPRVDKIICNSIGVEELFHRQLFFDKRKTAVINKGHLCEWYSNVVPHDIRSELNIPKEALLLINVANNRKMKGIPYLLEAMNLLPPEVAVHLLLVGRDMDSAENKNIISKGQMQNNIHFTGFRKDALSIVASCDAFVLSSITGESITKSVLEAMSLKVAPVISDIPGNRELVVNNENGLIFKSKNSKQLSRAIMKLYNNRDLCEKFGENSKKRIENELNNKRTISEMKKLYESLVIKTK